MFQRLFVLSVLLVMSMAAHAFTSGGSECTRTIPVSANFNSELIVGNAQGCTLKSHDAFEQAQMTMLKMCASLRGRYRAEAQNLVCGGENGPIKVAEGVPGYIEISGVCTIEGYGSCHENAQPVFWGVH